MGRGESKPESADFNLRSPGVALSTIQTLFVGSRKTGEPAFNPEKLSLYQGASEATGAEVADWSDEIKVDRVWMRALNELGNGVLLNKHLYTIAAAPGDADLLASAFSAGNKQPLVEINLQDFPSAEELGKELKRLLTSPIILWVKGYDEGRSPYLRFREQEHRVRVTLAEDRFDANSEAYVFISHNTQSGPIPSEALQETRVVAIAERSPDEAFDNPFNPLDSPLPRKDARTSLKSRFNAIMKHQPEFDVSGDGESYVDALLELEEFIRTNSPRLITTPSHGQVADMVVNVAITAGTTAPGNHRYTRAVIQAGLLPLAAFLSDDLSTMNEYFFLKAARLACPSLIKAVQSTQEKLHQPQ